MQAVLFQGTTPQVLRPGCQLRRLESTNEEERIQKVSMGFPLAQSVLKRIPGTVFIREARCFSGEYFRCLEKRLLFMER